MRLGARVLLADLERQALLTERATLSSGCSERRRQILNSCLVERDEARDCAWGFGGGVRRGAPMQDLDCGHMENRQEETCSYCGVVCLAEAVCEVEQLLGGLDWNAGTLARDMKRG